MSGLVAALNGERPLWFVELSVVLWFSMMVTLQTHDITSLYESVIVKIINIMYYVPKKVVVAYTVQLLH